VFNFLRELVQIDDTHARNAALGILIQLENLCESRRGVK
jgi:hypothetical protein